MQRSHRSILTFLAFIVLTSHTQAVANSNFPPEDNRVAYETLSIHKNVIREFEKAWSISKSGTVRQEGVVLILRMKSGRYEAKSLGATNQSKQFTFLWHPAIVAIVHTHPNDSDSRPSHQDCQVADRYKVPVFTLTIRGMYVYDPHTKRVSKVMNGLDWLDPAKWSQGIYLKLTGNSMAYISSCISLGM